jgi:hypothetical protein
MLNLISRFWQYLNRPDNRIRYKSGRLIPEERSDSGPFLDIIDLILPLWLQRIFILLVAALFGVYFAILIARLTGIIS